MKNSWGGRGANGGGGGGRRKNKVVKFPRSTALLLLLFPPSCSLHSSPPPFSSAAPIPILSPQDNGREMDVGASSTHFSLPPFFFSPSAHFAGGEHEFGAPARELWSLDGPSSSSFSRRLGDQGIKRVGGCWGEGEGELGVGAKKKSDDPSLTAGNRFHVHLPPKASQRHRPKRIAAAAAFA